MGHKLDTLATTGQLRANSIRGLELPQVWVTVRKPESKPMDTTGRMLFSQNWKWISRRPVESDERVDISRTDRMKTLTAWPCGPSQVIRQNQPQLVGSKSEGPL